MSETSHPNRCSLISRRRGAIVALAGRDGAAEIGAEVRALAARSRDTGLDAAAYLLDMAALEIGITNPT